MKVVLYQSWEELHPLATSWNEVLAASTSDTIFLTWEWCDAWWKNYGAGRSLFVLAAWEGSELVGVAPFYVDTASHWGTTWNCLRVIGDGSNDSDYMDCFARLGREHQIVVAFVDFLVTARNKWDWLQIEGTPENSRCLYALREYARERQWRFACEPIPCATLPLPKRWDEYLRMLQPRVRTKVRSCLARVEQELGGIPTECDRAENIEAWLPELFDLHARRWQQSHEPGVFRNPAKCSFYRDISRSAFSRGWLAFHRLAWGERPLALQYGFRYRNRFYLLQEGYDPGFEHLRPGIALRAWLMRHWIETGLEEYDFLAGTAPHKLEWGAQLKASFRVLLAVRRRGAWISMSAPHMYEDFKQSVQKAIPQPLLSRRREFLARRTRQGWNNLKPPAGPLARHVMRWSASHLYARTPFGGMVRRLATRYTWRPMTTGLHYPRLKPRSNPVCTIFIYHRVNDDQDPFFYAVPVSQFCAQMEYLARNFQLVSLDQVASGNLPANGHKYCVAITFDDGYRDNFLYAFPILKKLGIPATIFLTTGYIESGLLPWYDQVRLAFKLTLQSHISLHEIGGPDSALATQNARIEALARTLAWLRKLDDASRLQLLDELFRTLRVPALLNLSNTMLAWDEIRQMSKQGVCFGAHTVTHPVLATLPVQRLREEILGSKQTVENRLQLPVQHFAYPFGKKTDFSSCAKQIVHAAGFDTAVTTISGFNDPTQDRFELKRFCLREPDLGIFGLKLDWYRMSGNSTS